MVARRQWLFIVCGVILAQASLAPAQETESQGTQPRQAQRDEPLRFGSIAEMKQRGQTASIDPHAELKVSLKRTGGGYIGQTATFEVDIHNIGVQPTPRDASLVIKVGSSVGMEEYGLVFGVVAPNEKRTVQFEYKPLLPTVDFAVSEGIWDADSMGWTQDRAKARYQYEYDPKAPLTDFLPSHRQTASRPSTRLPAKVDEVPEVSFGDPITISATGPEGRFQVAGALAKIKHINRKKTDAYMELLFSNRPDLNGLPFVLGDSCRIKDDTRRRFAATTKQIRDIQRSRPGTEVIHGDFSDDRVMTETTAKIDKAGTTPEAVTVAALWQMITPESAGNRLELVKYLDRKASGTDAAQALAKLAIYSEEERIRSAALDALKRRRTQDYADVLVKGLSYPWPAVAERASAAIAKLGRSDLLPQLEKVLNQPDPRAPQRSPAGSDGKPKTVVRELVRINHLRNCTLCHAPAADETKDEIVSAEVPIPGEMVQRYYDESVPSDLRIRFDVTYLRQDFSVTLPVKQADPWPRMQRFDFVVRTREVDEKEAQILRNLLPVDAASPYHRAARAAITELAKLPK